MVTLVIEAGTIAFQSFAVISSLLAGIATSRMPSFAQTSYDIYDVTATSTPRPLMPYKSSTALTAQHTYMGQGTFENLTADYLELCAAQETIIPQWTLPENNTGLHNLVNRQVRLFASIFVQIIKNNMQST